MKKTSTKIIDIIIYGIFATTLKLLSMVIKLSSCLIGTIASLLTPIGFIIGVVVTLMDWAAGIDGMGLFWNFSIFLLCFVVALLTNILRILMIRFDIWVELHNPKYNTYKEYNNYENNNNYNDYEENYEEYEEEVVENNEKEIFFFKECKTLSEVKELHRALCKHLHPDNQKTGNEEYFNIMQSEYEYLMAKGNKRFC